MSDVDADLECDVCGQSATITGMGPVQLEHALQVFAGLHRHDPAEVEAWYRSEEARAAAYRGGDDSDPDGDEQDGGYR